MKEIVLKTQEEIREFIKNPSNNSYFSLKQTSNPGERVFSIYRDPELTQTDEYIYIYAQQGLITKESVLELIDSPVVNERAVYKLWVSEIQEIIIRKD